MKLIYQEAANKPGIYKIFNIYTNRIYIGQAQCFKKRWLDHINSLKGNRHQNKFLLNDYKKCFQELGHDDFLEFEVLEIMEGSTKEERNTREEKIIAEYWDNGKQCYNLRKDVREGKQQCWSNTPEETRIKLSISHKGIQAGENHPMYGKHHSEETKQKLSEAGKKRKHSKETKRKMSEAHKSRKCSEETKKKISKANKNRVLWNEDRPHPMLGKKHSKETRKKLSESHKEHKHSEETRKKISKTLKGKNTWSKGRKLSKEHKKKISKANKGRKRGPMSEEQKKRLSEAHRGQIPWNKGYTKKKKKKKS